MRAAAVDAESVEGGELGGEGEGGELEDEELEEGIRGGQSTFEIEAIAALARCSSFAAIEDGEEDGDEVACAFGGKGDGSLSSSSADTKKKKRKWQKQVSAKGWSGELPFSSSDASAMKSPGR